MSATPSIPDLSGRVTAPLRARRCVRHAEREAVARCSTCAGFYCRECVVDHAGRLLCASCLAKTTTAAAEEKPKRSFAVPRRGVMLAAAVFVSWVVFYMIGSWLLSIPAEYHEGTIWRRAFFMD